MNDIRTGMFAKSIAGHDKGEIYVIVNVIGSDVYVVDGKYKLLSKPKKKNAKHIEVIKIQNDISGADDVKIKRIIKTYKEKL